MRSSRGGVEGLAKQQNCASIQAHRIAKKVIKTGGENKFLGVGGSISVGVRKDFMATESGVARKDGKCIKAPN